MALEFVTKCNDNISQMNMDENQTLEIDALETAFPAKRQRKKKIIADELVNDEGNHSVPLADFRVNGSHCPVTRITICTTQTVI